MLSRLFWPTGILKVIWQEIGGAVPGCVFNSSFLCSPFQNLAVKELLFNWSKIATIVIKYK